MLSSYSIEDGKDLEGGCHEVFANVKKGSNERKYRFVLARKDVGRKKGALMTRTLTAL